MNTHEPEDHSERLRRIERLLSSRDPLPRDYIVPATEEATFLGGTMARAVSDGMGQRPSGLWVPRTYTAVPQPIDQVMTYLTAEEILGFDLPAEAVGVFLGRVPRESAVRWSAFWLAKLRNHSLQSPAVDELFIQETFQRPHANRIRNLLRSGNRALLTFQGLTTLMKLALVNCRDEVELGDDSTVSSNMAMAFVALAEHLSDHVELAQTDGEWVITETPGPLGREFAANLLFNSHPDLTSRLAMFQRVWKELPAEVSDQSRVVDLPAIYEEATGVPLDDLAAICCVLWAGASNQNPTIEPSYLQELQLDPERVQAVLKLIAGTPSQMAQMVADEAEQFGVAWSVRTFGQYPVVQWPSGMLTVLDPSLLIDRSTGLWPLFDIQREFASQDRAQEAVPAASCVRKLAEHYALEAVEGVVGKGTRSRLYSEAELKAAFRKRPGAPRGGGKVADAAVDYGHAWIVIEVTTVTLSAATVAAANDESFMRDIDDYVEKLRQVEATVNNLRGHEERLTGHPRFNGARRFHPVLVVANRIAVEPIFMTLLKERVAKEGLLSGPDVAPVTIMDIEDLDALEGLQEDGGPSMLAVLEGRSNSNLLNVSVKDYILRGLGHRPPRPKRVGRLWKHWFDTAIEVVKRPAA